LIAKARDQLAESDPEAFKVFLLAIMVGLRRKGCRGLPDIFERWFLRSASIGNALIDSGLSKSQLARAQRHTGALLLFRGAA